MHHVGAVPSGITRDRMESFDRKITEEPQYFGDKKDALIHDFQNYLGIIKAVHEGADLQVHGTLPVPPPPPPSLPSACCIPPSHGAAAHVHVNSPTSVTADLVYRCCCRADQCFKDFLKSCTPLFQNSE